MTNGMVSHAQCAQGVNPSSPGPFASLASPNLSLLKRVLMQVLVPRFGAAVRGGKSSLTQFLLKHDIETACSLVENKPHN